MNCGVYPQRLPWCATLKLCLRPDYWRNQPAHQRSELVSGRLLVREPGAYEHGKLLIVIGAKLFTWITSRGLGDVVGAETGFTLRKNPDTVRAPDAAFISTARVPRARVTGFAELARISSSKSCRRLTDRVRCTRKWSIGSTLACDWSGWLMRSDSERTCTVATVRQGSLLTLMSSTAKRYCLGSRCRFSDCSARSAYRTAAGRMRAKGLCRFGD